MRVLQVTPYPTVDPRHGGQIRASQIATELRAAGHEVKSFAIYVEEDYPNAGEDDIPFNPDSKYWNPELPWLSDYFSGLFAVNDETTLFRLQSLVNSFRPHCVIVEHPWLFQAIHLVAQSDTILIYSSQNIEWRLKSKLLERLGHPERAELVSAIRKIEDFAALSAHLVIACTDADLQYYRDISGKKTFQGVVAGNGVEPFTCTEQRVADWYSFFNRPMPVFVSSAHVPNAQGFWDMMAPGLTFLRPEEEILVVGGVSSIILNSTGFKNYSEVNLSRLNLAGTREKTELQALVKASHVVLLPITDGEGSNLKTAEALESGLPIVATSKAFRGFESAISLKHVQIADNPKDFRMAIRRSLNQPRLADLTPVGMREKFYWKNQLSGLVNAVNQYSFIYSG
ncbi:glycosyltransferase family 4 protein [Acidithiobacillus thiooxidans]|uniref:glycosyltransferase n=1 Tax=Acidithiobacillus TaxID=119977 RepID=UPI001879CC50|nr:MULTISPECIES: glycosyltransferase [Acidithiobacillus]MBE7565875.1 glycosyltransferase [Acidithiobacillus sp. HP-11]MBU2749424.1 glycosyltransferase family 4 protein [Acidithiobacillus thiooxidans]